MKVLRNNTIIRLPKTPTEQPYPEELAVVRNILQQVQQSGKTCLAFNHTQTWFEFEFSTHSFTANKLQFPIHNAYELWPYRMMMCLRQLGWQADGMIVGDLPPGNVFLNPEEN
jgi:hypothetical protein